MEPCDQKLMVSLGHPNVAEYKAEREFFDSLKYACNSSARLFSYGKSGKESSQYWAPSLRLAWNPVGMPGFSHVYPNHDDWMSYIRAAAEAGWPKGAAPSLRHGSWTLNTHDLTMLDGLKLLAKKGAMPLAIPRYDQRDITITPDGPHAHVVHQGIMDLVRKHHEDFILPPRTATDVQAELPLAQKTLRLANVKRLAVEPRFVLVPLIPMGEPGQVLATETAEHLVRLVEEGFPFAQASDWLKKMAPKAYASLRRKHYLVTTQDKRPAARPRKNHDHMG